ncbi:MAG: OmpA family protein, partial [Spirochaetaceae bacterium]
PRDGETPRGGETPRDGETPQGGETPQDGETPQGGETPPTPASPAEADAASIAHETGLWTVYFGPDTAELTSAGRSVIAEAAASLEAHDTAVNIEGHTAYAGNSEGREELSLLRAQIVADALRDQGIEASRIQRVEGFAAEYPVSSTPDEQHLDRRAEIIEFVPED